MRLGFALLAILLMVAAGNVLAADTGVQSYQMMIPDGSVDKVRDLDAGFTMTRTDTIYFGGDDGNGIAFQGGIWDFDTIVSDPFQGFTSVDKTANPGDYFARVVAADFDDDPCAPIFGGSTGQLWCGIHEDEAMARDFLAGMGYQNLMCQNAFSPMFDYAGESLDIGFTYFNDTEVDYDYTYVYVACFDAAGVALEAEDAEYQVDLLTGIIASYTAPVAYAGHVDAGLLPAATEKVKLQIRMWSDTGYSDEDGSWDTVCGPFACDDVSFTIGAGVPEVYDFEADDENWTFSRCLGVGAYMGIVEPATYEMWLDEVGLLCDCALNGNALECTDEDNSPFSPPGHPIGQLEEISTGTTYRGIYGPPEYNTVLCYYTNFLLLTLDRGTFYRPGYKTYPYTTEVNPLPHWSPRKGQNTWHYAGDAAVCAETGYNLSTIGGNAGDPMPVEWDSCKFVYEVYCSAAAFGQVPTPDEGNTLGTPVLDDVQIALTGAANAPVISFQAVGHQWHDGFGQLFPSYLEPSDRGNVNITRDWSSSNDPDENDWMGDTAAIAGPAVNPNDPLTEWQVELCFRISHVGPRQQMVPEYHAWKARLDGDPETDFVCVLMDSIENGTTVYNSQFSSYFHEDYVGYDAASGNLSEANEILPDGIFTPGTAFEYYYAAKFVNIPDSDTYIFPGVMEFEILPRMRLSGDSDYSVEWPSFLYVDAFNNGVEYYVNPTLVQMGIEADKYDYLDCSSNWKTPFKRSFSLTGAYNPGGYGNNGCTVDQLLGYRMIFVNTGTYTTGCMESSDWNLFTSWLNSAECDFPNIRRGIVFDGDEVVAVMRQAAHQPAGGDFLNQMLGATQVAPNYREYVSDWEYCVYLSGTGSAFDPLDDTSVYGNGCPNTYNYNVLGLQGGVGAMGNLVYFNDGIGETEFAQVVRSNTDYPYNWRSVVNGFSVHHLSWVGCGGDECASDSSCIVNAAANILMPTIDWILDGADAFDPWLYPCNDTAVDEDPVSHSNVKVNFLRGASPNPFRSTATIRFSLAETGNVDFAIYDVSGRLVKSLGETVFEAGDNAIAWDGTDNGGNRVGGGIFWMQMNTQDGFSSGKKMIVLR